MKGQRRDRETHAAKDRSGLSLLAVQSIVCGVVLLIALLLRLIGGETWTQLRSLLQQWMTEEGLSEVIADQIRGEETTGAGGRSVAVGDALSVKQLSFETAQPELKLPPVVRFPLDSGWVTSPFGYRVDPIQGGTGFHTGTDVAAPAGASIYAVYDGEVIASTWDDSYGYYVTVRCVDGIEITYAHCSRLRFRAGETVSAGDVVAHVGSTGESTGNHVHIMLVQDGVHYDPKPLIPEAWYA